MRQSFLRMVLSLALVVAGSWSVCANADDIRVSVEFGASVADNEVTFDIKTLNHGTDSALQVQPRITFLEQIRALPTLAELKPTTTYLQKATFTFPDGTSGHFHAVAEVLFQDSNGVQYSTPAILAIDYERPNDSQSTLTFTLQPTGMASKSVTNAQLTIHNPSEEILNLDFTPVVPQGYKLQGLPRNLPLSRNQEVDLPISWQQLPGSPATAPEINIIVDYLKNNVHFSDVVSVSAVAHARKSVLQQFFEREDWVKSASIIVVTILFVVLSVRLSRTFRRDQQD
jgi:hypothetical protein